MEKKGEIVKERVKTKTIRKLTSGVFSVLTDTILFTLYLIGASLGKKANSRDVYKTFTEADEALSKLNYQTFNRAFQKLREEGFISSIKDWSLEPIITQTGMQKLQSITPTYDEKRIWDKNLYLVNYDVDIKHNQKRVVLRSMLKRIGAIKLQDSLYVTCYNPSKILTEFLEENNLEGTVLVSHLGRKGFLGKDNLREFLWEVTDLKETNLRYKEFIQKYNNVSILSQTQLTFEFLSILQDDPQLPFDLLPDEYLGNEAYLLYLQLKKKFPL